MVLGRCTSVMTRDATMALEEENRKRLLEVNAEFASQGLRVLALATRIWPDIPDRLLPENVEGR